MADGITLSHRGERHFSQAPGLAGGGDGASAYSVVIRADGREEVVPSKCQTVLNRGDRLRVETAGGGGYGDPGARDPAALARDLADGKTRPAAAE